MFRPSTPVRLRTRSMKTGVEPKFFGIIHVPGLVPGPGTPTVTPEHLPSQEIEAIRALGLP